MPERLKMGSPVAPTPQRGGAVHITARDQSPVAVGGWRMGIGKNEGRRRAVGNAAGGGRPRASGAHGLDAV